jgi:hypothetical protein
MAGVLSGAPASAVDHNNLDATRPLSFDDASSLALGEQALEIGLRASWPRRRALGVGLNAEYLYGFAPNSHLDIGFDPVVGGRSDTAQKAFSYGDVLVGAFRSLRREYGNAPALALRADAFLPSGRGSSGVDFRLRAILSKSVQQFNRLHVNLDLSASSAPGKNERRFSPGLVFGYSRPLGFPRSFTQTLLAELGVQAGARRGSGPLVTAGLGLRRQFTVRSVLDVGLQADLSGANGSPRDRLRVILGLSTGF